MKLGKTLNAPRHGNTRRRNCFCFFPTAMSNGDIIWLEWCNCLEQYDSYNGYWWTLYKFRGKKV